MVEADVAHMGMPLLRRNVQPLWYRSGGRRAASFASILLYQVAGASTIAFWSRSV